MDVDQWLFEGGNRASGAFRVRLISAKTRLRPSSNGTESITASEHQPPRLEASAGAASDRRGTH